MPLEPETFYKLVCDVHHSSECFAGDEVMYRVCDSEQEARQMVEDCGGRVEANGTVVCGVAVEEGSQVGSAAHPEQPKGEEGAESLTKRLADRLTAAMALLHPGGNYTPEDPASMASLWNEELLPVLRDASDAGFPINSSLLQMAPVTAHEYRASQPDTPAEEGS